MLLMPPGCVLRTYEVSFPAHLTAAIPTPKSLWPSDWIEGELFATKRRSDPSVPTHALLVSLYSDDATVGSFTVQTSADSPAASLPLYRSASANEAVVDAFRLGLSAAFLEVGQPLVAKAKESSKLTVVFYHFNLADQLTQQARILRRLGLGC
jgi:hypothetical protein